MLSSQTFVASVAQHYSYSQFPWPPLGTPGAPTALLCPKYEEEKWLADYEPCCLRKSD